MELKERLEELRIRIEKADTKYLETIQRGHKLVATINTLSPQQVFSYCQKMLDGMSWTSQGQLEYSHIETNTKTILDFAKSISFLEGKEKLEEYQLKDSATGREKLVALSEDVLLASDLYGEAGSKSTFCRDNFQIFKSALETAKKIIDFEKSNNIS